jgi:hypothetical protein
MSDRQERAKRWLEEHAAELEQEELPSEQEKMEAELSLDSGRWPEPRSVPSMGVFARIEDEDSFNRVIGDTANWPVLRHRSVLYRNWVLPHAILIFGKRWFDRCKWRSSIQRGVPFPLFDEAERQQARENGLSLDETPAGRVRIARISSRVEHALSMYLEGGGLAANDSSAEAKAPGGYITDAIKNEFMREIADENGYKLARVRACPYCLKTRKGRSRRVALVFEGDNRYSCDRCASVMRNLEGGLGSMQDGMRHFAKDELKRVRVFASMSGTASLCPNEGCRGIVPLNAVGNPAWWATAEGTAAKTCLELRKSLKGSKRFRKPPPELADMPLECPYCGKRFSPRSAPGGLTGLPTIFVWRVQDMDRLDKPSAAGRRNAGSSMKEALADDSHDIEGRIAARQRAEMLMGELAIRASESSGGTVSAILSRCFYLGAADWLAAHPDDASAYFLDWESSSGSGDGSRMTKVVKGKEASVHQTILHAWMARIERAMPELRKAKDGRMRSLRDLKWLCQPPLYAGGPKSSFSAQVGPGLRVPSRSRLGRSAKNRPRIAWILSLRRADGQDLTQHIRACEWHAVLMEASSGLSAGDRVEVEALMMPGHHCHAPIQRIIRLRTSVLSSIVEKIRLEEETGETDPAFWNDWRKRADEAMRAVGMQHGAST